MSVALLLIPAAMAAAAAISGARSGRDASGRVVCEVRTRMRDVDLLGDALRATGAVVTAESADLVATWDGVQARFARDEAGIWSAHFTGDVDEARAIELATRIDAAYGLAVQRKVVERLRERAPAAGLRLETEDVAADRSIRMVFQVEATS